MLSFVRKHPLLLIILVFNLLYLYLSLTLHFRFGTTDADLAIYAQHNWFISVGEFFGYGGTFKDFSFFGDHMIVHLIWMSWLYYIWHSSAVLIVVQTLAIVFSAIPIYWFARERLKDKFASLLLITSYLLFYGFQAAEIFPFHGAAISSFFVSFTLWFAYKRQWKLYFLALVGALFAKEDVPTFTFVLGIYLFFVRRDRKIGLITSILSLIYFYIVIFKIIPFFTRGIPYTYIVANQNQIVSNPLLLIKTFFIPIEKIKTQLTLFGSFGFLPLFSPSTLFLAAPFLVARFTSATTQRWGPWMHYSANQAAILGFGSVWGLENLANILGKIRFLSALVVDKVRFYRTWLLFTLISSVVIGLSYKPIMPLYRLFDYHFYQDPPGLTQMREALKLIPDNPNVSVATQSGFLPHLCLRRRIYMYPHPSKSINGPREDLSDEAPIEAYAVPDADYIILSKYAFHWRPNNLTFDEKVLPFIRSLSNYKIIYDQNSTIVLRKKNLS